MLTIVHFHPNHEMATRFVIPLITFEKKIGFNSKLVVGQKKYFDNDCFEFKYKINLWNFFFLPFKLIHLCFFISKLKPDIIISHNSTSSLLPIIASVILKVKHKIYFNHGVPYKSYKGLFRFMLLFLEFLNCNLSSQILTVSDQMRKILLNISNKKVEIINNGSACGIDLKNISKIKLNSSFKRKLNVKNNDFVVLYVGRPVERKGFKFLLNLWCKHFIKCKNIKLLLCGCSKGDVIKEINELPGNIISLGFVEKIEEIYLSSDLLILPSMHEGFPYAVLEALASKCVVIGNNIEGINSIIEHNHNGFLIKNNALNSYANKINFLKSNLEIRKKISKQGLVSVKKYSRPEFLLKYGEFLKETTRLI